MMNNTGNTTAAQPMTDAGQPQAITNDEVISQLNGLIETCRDGQEGFKQSAEGVDRDDPVLVHDQRIEARPALRGKDLRHRIRLTFTYLQEEIQPRWAEFSKSAG